VPRPRDIAEQNSLGVKPILRWTRNTSRQLISLELEVSPRKGFDRSSEMNQAHCVWARTVTSESADVTLHPAIHRRSHSRATFCSATNPMIFFRRRHIPGCTVKNHQEMTACSRPIEKGVPHQQ
jgi:hypothetical protein